MKKHLFLLSACQIAMSISAVAQTFVSTAPSNKNVVVEEFTGINCRYCPDGHRIVNQMMVSNPNRVFGINIHSGGYAANTYTTTDGDRLRANWNVTSFPAGMVNRTTFGSASSPVLNRTSFSSSANAIMNQPSCANIAARCTIDCATRVMTVNVELFYTDSSKTDTNYLSVALLQDNILGPQVGSSFNPSQIVDGQYNHQHMFRGFVNGSTWGDTVCTTDSGSFVSRTYTYTLPASISNVPVILHDLSVVAFVSEGVNNIITACKADVSYQNATLAFSDMRTYEKYMCDMDFYTYVSLVNLTVDTIRSVEIRYGATSGNVSTITRSGLELSHLQSDTLRLPPITGNFASGTDYRGFAKITAINGQAVNGDSTSCVLNKLHSSATGDSITFTLTTDNYGSETTYQFKSYIGRIIASGGPFSNSSTTHTIKLPVPSNGCYRLEINDSQGDGINGGYGNGHFSIADNSGTIITHDGKFTNKVIVFLSCTRGAAGIQYATSTHFDIYPNPVKNTLRIDCEQQVEKVEVIDMQGKMLITLASAESVDVSSLAKGSYILRITTADGHSTRTFVKE